MEMKHNGYFIAAITAGSLLMYLAVNSQITDSVTQTPNPNIERSNLINGQVPPNTPTKTMFESRILTEPQTDAKGKKTGMVLVTHLLWTWHT